VAIAMTTNVSIPLTTDGGPSKCNNQMGNDNNNDDPDNGGNSEDDIDDDGDGYEGREKCEEVQEERQI
jgi:hypothetical protein